MYFEARTFQLMAGMADPPSGRATRRDPPRTCSDSKRQRRKGRTTTHSLMRDGNREKGLPY